MRDGAVEVIVEDPRWEALGLDALAARAVAATLDHLGAGPEVEIALLAGDDARIAALNGQFRGKPVPTNVLSWPSETVTPPDLPEDDAWGDVALAWETCAAEAATQGKRPEDHVTHLIVHAVLHLAGHDHLTDPQAETMEAAERSILNGLGIADPYAERETGT